MGHLEEILSHSMECLGSEDGTSNGTVQINCTHRNIFQFPKLLLSNGNAHWSNEHNRYIGLIHSTFSLSIRVSSPNILRAINDGPSLLMSINAFPVSS